MIPKDELEKATELARKYHIGKFYLVGSALSGDPEEANDYDFVVEDVPPGRFFSFYGELMAVMPKPVDVILLTNDGSRFERLIHEEAQLIYEQAKT